MRVRSRFEGRNPAARVAWIAVLAFAFLLAGTNGRYLADAARHRPAATTDAARPGPTEPGGEAPPMADASTARLFETPSRLRFAATRGLAAARKPLRQAPAGDHHAALPGASYAAAAAARDRERLGPTARPHPAPATWVVARGPPLLGR